MLGTGPAAYHKCYAGIADGKRQAAEKVASINPHGVEIDFIIHTEDRTGPGDAGEAVSGLEDNALVFDIDLSVVAEIGNFPLAEIAAVKQTDFSRRHVFEELS